MQASFVAVKILTLHLSLRQFARNTQRLTKAITKLHELWAKDQSVPLTNHMKRIFKPALY